jgi:hypothetical protein
LWHIDPSLGNDRETRQQPLLGSGQRPNGLARKRCYLRGQCLDVISRTVSECSSVQLSEVQTSDEVVCELVRELRFSRRELLLLEAGS